jgi:adenylate cyclase
VATARTVLEATGHGSANGPWLPLGAGVHTGPAWIGAVGDGDRTDLTALGDTVNTTARLASVAGVGEILVSAAAAAASGLEPGLEHRSLELKGKAQPTEVVVLRV